MIIKVFNAIVGLTALLTVASAQPTYYPDGNWQTRKPEEFNINKRLLDSAVSFAKANETKVERDLRIANLKAFSNEPGYQIIGPMKERGGPAGLIIKDGYIIAQWGDVDRVDMTYSVAKSFLSTIAGLAIDDGLIKSVKDRVVKYVWDDTFESPHNSKITWEHLLTQSSDWSGALFGIPDWADRPPKEGGIDDWKYRKLLEPGTFFRYNDVRVNVLAYSLLQVWRKPLPMVLKDKIMDPIGASTAWRWYGYNNSFINVDGIMMQSVSGGGHHGGGIFISAMDQARFGLLFLRNGKWKDQQLISKDWIDAARQPSLQNKDYGYMWWTNATQKWEGVSRNLYYAAGFGGNYIVIDNEHNLVIVARWMDSSKMGDLVKLIIKSMENKL
ncbi:MAG TPA: serine hydrolase [Flavitalea sp.]|nr:serine hydrolase [Flavitalea sp.]